MLGLNILNLFGSLYYKFKSPLQNKYLIQNLLFCIIEFFFNYIIHITKLNINPIKQILNIEYGTIFIV